MSGVSDGQFANETTFNDAFMARNGDTDTTGKVGLLNTDVDSGPSVTNPQKYLNHLGDVVGATQDGGAADLEYASNNYIIDGDSRKEAIEVLDVALADVQDQIDVHETRLDAHDVTLAAHTTQLNDHETRLDAAEITIADHETRLDTIETGNQTLGGNKTFSGNVTVQGDLQVDGTMTTVNSATLEVTDANILVNNGGNDATSEGAGLTVERTTTNAALQFESALASKFKIGLIGALYEIIVSGVAQTITGIKDFVSGIKADTIAESTTNAGVTVDGLLIKDGFVQNLINVTNDAQLKRAANDLNTFAEKTTLAPDDIFIIEDSADSFNKKKVKNSNAGGGGSGGSGSKNYLGVVNNINGNGNFELGSTTKWSLTHSTLDSTTKLPNQASGSWTSASANLAFTAVTSGKLAGSYSGQLQQTSGNSVAGDMVISDAFTLDTEDLAKPLSFKFSYQLTAGAANTNFSGTSSNSVGVAIYDVTAGTWIQPAGVFNLVQNSGVGIATGTFQPPITSTQLRFAVYFPNASTGTFTMLVDSLFVGPQVTAAGAAISDLTNTYTAVITGSTVAGSMTYTSNTLSWQQIGDQIRVTGNIRIATVTTSPTGTVYINLPPNINYDTAKLSDGGRGAFGATVCKINSVTTPVNWLTISSPNTNSVVFTSGVIAPGPFVATDEVKVDFLLPIAGWSSNTVMSNDTDTRVVALSVFKTTAQSIPNTTEPLITGYNAPLVDTHASFNSTTGEYTIPVSGTYRVTANVGYETNATGYRYNSIRKNGSVYQYGLLISAVATDGNMISANAIMNCVAGDVIAQYAYQNSGGALNTRPLSGVTSLHIERLSGQSVIAASETVACEYNSSAGGAIANATDTFIDFGTKESDTHNAVVGAGSGNSTTYTNTWRFVAPVSGRYQVNALVSIGASGGNVLNYSVAILKNGIGVQLGNTYYLLSAAVQSSNYAVTVNGTVKCNAGDAISVSAYQNNGASRTMVPNSVWNRVSIVKVGN